MTTSDIMGGELHSQAASGTTRIIHLLKTWEALLKIVWHNIRLPALQILKSRGVATCWNPSSSGSLSNKSPLSLTSAPVSPSRVRFSLWRCRTRELSCKSTGGLTKRSPKPLIATWVLLNSSFSKSLPEVSTACHPGLQSKHSFHTLSPRLSGWSRVWSLESDWGSGDQFHH